MRDRTERLLDRAIERAALRPAYLGWVFRRYMELEDVSWDVLANDLGEVAAVSSLALCLRPRPEHFAADVRVIATKFGLDAAALARVVRLVDAAEVLQAGGTGQDLGTLLAARPRPAKGSEHEGPDG